MLDGDRSAGGRRAAAARGSTSPAVTVEPPRDPAHGDMATNAAMVLARPARHGAARARRGAGRRRSRGAPGIVSAEVAGPGFLNLRLEPGALVRGDPAGAGGGRRTSAARRSAPGGGSTSSSSRPTRPGRCTSGHVRGAVFGDALAGLLDFAGHEVTREYYINDGGAQVDVLARSAYERYREACGLEPAIAEGLYPGDYLIPVGEALKAKYGDSLLDQPESDWLAEVRDVRHRGDDGDDPRRPRAARRADGPLLLREVALRHRPDRGGAGGAGGARGCSTRACSSRPRASCPRTGSRASRRCSARPPTATTPTGR